jgi:hypothetical protein
MTRARFEKANLGGRRYAKEVCNLPRNCRRDVPRYDEGNVPIGRFSVEIFSVTRAGKTFRETSDRLETIFLPFGTETYI